MTNRSGRFLPLFTVVLAACSFGNQPGKRGELGNDRFFYACVDDADAMCDGADLETEPLYGMPRIALSSRFGIDTEGYTTEARAVNDRLTEELSTDGIRAFTANEPGWTTIMSRTYDEEAVDIIHVLVAEATTLQASEREIGAEAWGNATGTLAIADEHELRVAPFDAEGKPLAGGLDIKWAAEPDGIVDILPETGNNVVTIRPQATGAVTITATVNADLAATVSLDVTYDGGGGGGGGGGTGGGAQGGGGAGGGQ